MVKEVEGVPAELGVGPPDQGESLGQRRVEIYVTRPIEDAAAAVAVGVGRRRDEVLRVVPEIDRRGVELARTGSIGPTWRPGVDSRLHEDRERPPGGQRPDPGELPAAGHRTEQSTF